MQQEVLKKVVRPIPFIIKRDDKYQEQAECSKYQVTQEAVQFLKAINTSFSVVTVAGLYRTGKSYLLNQVVLDKQTGFDIGSTVNACTKGLWLWGQLISTNDNKHYLVIDTQGLGALDQQTNHDMKIICLAVLLSTNFIYNSQGSIDQNALQTLSLVLNLVSTIDKEQISARPDFIWVVRDFALQLITTEGHSLTPKEYLEHALNLQNSKQSHKVQIRNTILSAFKQRDCFTLIKPLIDQQKLQNLNQLPNSQIRGQFLQQCSVLRRKIMSNLKPFTLNSKNPLKGTDYVKIAKQYVQAINEGKVPCMMDTWTYIRQEKARQVIQQIHQKYSQKIQVKLASKMPMPMLQLNQSLEAYSKQIMDYFNKNAYDGTSTDQIQRLIAHSQNQLKKLNLQQTKSTLNTLLNKDFQSYKKKLYSQFYPLYEDFKKDLMNNFKNQFLQRYREKYDYIQEICGAYTQSKIIEGFSYFEKQLRSQIQKQKQITEQVQKRMGKDIQDSVYNSNQQRRKLKETIQQLQKQNFSLGNKTRALQNDVNKEKLNKNKTADEFQRKNEQLMTMVDKLTTQIKQKNNLISEENKNIYIKEKQLQKQRALFIQKQTQLGEQISLLKEKLQVCAKKEKEFLEKLQQEKKQVSQKYEKQLKQLEKTLAVFQERNSQLQISNIQLQKDLEYFKEELKAQQIKNNNQRQILMKKLQIAQMVHQSEAAIQDIKVQLKKSEQKVSKLGYQNREFQIRNKQAVDQMNNVKSSCEKEMAIHLQKIQFQDIQIRQLKGRNQQLKKNYHLALQNLQDNSKNIQQNYQMKMFEQKAEYQGKIKTLQYENEQKIKEYKRQIQSINQSKQEALLQMNLLKKNYQAKERQWKQANNSLQQLYQKAEEKLVSTQRDHQDIYKEKEGYFKLRVKQLEQELEDVKEKASLQIDENQSKSQQAIAILKKYSEMEKINFEKRLSDQKQKSEKRMKTLNQELEQKFNQEKQSYDQQIAQLQDKIVQMQRVFNQKLQNTKYDSQITLQQTIKKFMDEKVQITRNNALLQQQLNLTKKSMQKQLQDTKYSLNKQMDSLMRKLTNDYSQEISRIKDQKQNIDKKYDSLKKNNKQTQQNNLLLKNELQKEKAVSKQKIKNLELKLQECQNKLKLQLQSFNATIENLNQTNQNERRRLNRQIENLSYQYNQLNRQKTQVQSNYETDKQMKQTRISYLQMVMKRGKDDYQDILNKFQKTVQHLTKEKQNIKRDEYKNQSVIAKIKADCDEQMRQKDDERMSIIRDYEERLQRLKHDNRQLKDKLLMLEIRPSNNQRLSKNHESQLAKLQEKHRQQKEDYERIIKKLKKDNHMLCEGFDYRSKQVEMLRDHNCSMLEQSNISNRVNAYDEKQQRNSIEGYNARHSSSTRHLLSDNKNITNVSNMGRKSTHTVIQQNNANYAQRNSGPRVIPREQQYNGIRRYNNPKK